MFSYLFLFAYLYTYYFHLVTYLSIDTVFPFSVLAIKAVA